MLVSCVLKSMATMLLGATMVGALDQGPIVIKQDGKILNLRVAATEAGMVKSSSNGSSITMKWGGETRAFVVKDKMADMSANNYHSLTLLDREIAYDIDLSNVGCSCNAALFFVSYEGFHKDGSVARGCNAPYYCDANNVGGVWCWEMDTIEGNKWAMQTAPHTCNAPAGGYISSCDRGGCGTNSFHVDPLAMGPGSLFKIDTHRPFRIHQRYESHKGRLIAITNRIVQGRHAFEWSVCPKSSYLKQMSGALASSMKMVFQLWGEAPGTMSWLDEPLCTDSCDTDHATMTISNIEISKLNKQAAVFAEVPTNSNAALVAGISIFFVFGVFGIAVSFVRRSMRREALAEPLMTQ